MPPRLTAKKSEYQHVLHGEYLGGNPLTGRKVWLVHHIIGDDFGDPWDWSVVVIKSHFFSRTAFIKGAMQLNNYQARKSLQGFLADMGFTWAKTCSRNDVLKKYQLPKASQAVPSIAVTQSSS